MTKTSDEMKRLVGEFISVTGIKYEDQTDKIKEKSNNMIEWQYHVGTNVIVSKSANRPDRVHVNVNMRFAPKDTRLLTMSNPSFSKTVMEVSEICTICGVGYQWVKEKDSIMGLAVFSHVDEQGLNRIAFHDVWDNVARVSGHVQKVLRANFGGMSAATGSSSDQETFGKTMYG